MLFPSSFADIQNSFKPIIEHKNIGDFPSSLKKQNLVLDENSKTNSPKSVSYESLNKNGSDTIEKKSDLNYINQIKPKSKNEIFNNIFNNTKFFLNQKNNSSCVNFDINGKSNHLESNIDNSREFDKFFQIPDFEEHLYKTHRDSELYNRFLTKYPLISTAFTKKDNVVNYIDIYQKNKIIRKYISKSFEPRPLIHNTIKNTRFIINPNLKKNHSSKKKEINQDKKLNFNVPENFLINYNINKITINNIQYTEDQENLLKCINLNDMEEFINSLCMNIVNKKENLSNLNFVNKEYIEFQNFDINEEENIPFLQRKRSNILDFDYIEDFYPHKAKSPLNNSEIKKKPLKKKYKNKKKYKKMSKKLINLNRINNKKDGEKIDIYLNQIQINKNKLENFPFFPMIGIKENIKIEFLKGVIDKKNLIKVNKKTELIKDQRNFKYLKNKIFELTYINEEKDKQYTIYIKGFHILYLILYYYYQIQEGIRLINKNHYSHGSFSKSYKIMQIIERLIKTCNRISIDISIDTDLFNNVNK